MSVIATYGLTKHLNEDSSKMIWDIFLNLGDHPARFIARFDLEYLAVKYLDTLVDGSAGQIGNYKPPMYTIHGK